MTDQLLIWIQYLTPGEQRLMIGLSILAVLLVFSCFFREPLRYWRETRQITRAIKRIGARFKRDIALPDGLGGEIRIDYLALSRDAILVIGVKRYDGMIFGSTQTDEWTQTVNSRSYRFPNPDTFLAQQVSAVRNIIPKTTVRGLHLFTNSAAFPWDKPPNVLQIKDLRSSVTRRPAVKDIPGELRAAWSHLLQSRTR
jgi:Nuclease-related domain